jgi:hypothetical protein
VAVAVPYDTIVVPALIPEPEIVEPSVIIPPMIVVTVRVLPLIVPTNEHPCITWGAAAVAETVVPNVPVIVGAPLEDTAVYT